MPTNKTTLFARRHYEFLARVLAECRDNPALLEFYDTDSQFWRKLNMHFAARLDGTNPNFNIQLFMKACDPKNIDNSSPPENPKKLKRIQAMALEGWERANSSKIVFKRGNVTVSRDSDSKKWKIYTKSSFIPGAYHSAQDAMTVANKLIRTV